MVLKTVFAAVACALSLILNGLAIATEIPADSYQAGQFLGLDLSQAMLSPKLLGPTTQFQPLPVEASTEPPPAAAESRIVKLETVGPDTAKPNTAKPRTAGSRTAGFRTARSKTAGPKTASHLVLSRMKVAQARSEKPRRVAAKKSAGSHGNPLDAEAMDTRIQVWPCRSGGICNWRE